MREGGGSKFRTHRKKTKKAVTFDLTMNGWSQHEPMNVLFSYTTISFFRGGLDGRIHMIYFTPLSRICRRR